MSTSPIVVNFHTPDRAYTEYAEKLAASCALHGIELFQKVLPKKQSWCETCALKGPFCLWAFEELKRPIIWIDADAEVRQNPIRIMESNDDFAIYARLGGLVRRQAGREEIKLPANWPGDEKPRWFDSGTVMFNDTPAAHELLKRWAVLCLENPHLYDQWTLQQAWADTKMVTELRTDWLPHGYCKIDKMAWEKNQPKHLYIEHHCASAELRVDRK